MKRLVIIGGVAAGATAAARARRLDEEAEITLLEAGPYVSFANCGLPYFIGGDIQSREALILQSPETFEERYRVRVLVNTAATALDRKAKFVRARTTVRDESGAVVASEEREFPYDSLILAQGGRPIRPGIPGADLPHVHTLWTIPEMDALEGQLTVLESAARPGSVPTALVVGGGFIGLEMAEAFRLRGLRVELVEAADHVMPLFEDEMAAALEEELRSHGVLVQCRRKVVEILPDRVRLDDGSELAADLVLLSVGVAPELGLARSAGLEIGKAGGLAVDEELRTSDPYVWAAGDMVEVANRVSGRVQRLPLAGPANRQGRIAATNALGGRLAYPGGLGTSVVKLFDLTAASTGLSLGQARSLGITAQAAVVHKPHHASYYPGSEEISLSLVYGADDGRILGAQAVGADSEKRIDVVAAAIAGKLGIDDLADLDLAYAPPYSSANDPLNMVSFVAQNRLGGQSPSVSAAEFAEAFASGDLVLDVRDPEEAADGRLVGAVNIPLNELRERMEEIRQAAESRVWVHCASGYRGHLAVRILRQRGFRDPVNVAGGMTSLKRFAAVNGNLAFEVEAGSGSVAGACLSGARIIPPQPGRADVEESPNTDRNKKEQDVDQALIVDVRTSEEFAEGAYPGAVNIPLDALVDRHGELGAKDRRIVLYCASGGRSSYAQMLLSQIGFSQVENGGGLRDMLAKRR